MLFAAVFSIATGVGGCWWTNSARAVLVDVAFWKFSNNPPNYASVDDAITLLVILYSTCTGPFWRVIDCIGVLDFCPRKKYPPALFCVSSYEMWDASE